MLSCCYLWKDKGSFSLSDGGSSHNIDLQIVAPFVDLNPSITRQEELDPFHLGQELELRLHLENTELRYELDDDDRLLRFLFCAVEGLSSFSLGFGRRRELMPAAGAWTATIVACWGLLLRLL